MDLSLPELALAMALSYGGAHPLGHIAEANRQGVPGRVDYQALVERYDPTAWAALTDEQKAKVHSAGFEGQQVLANALVESPMADEMRVVNALYKVGYAADIKPKDTEGDPQLLADTTGTSRGRINSLLAISAGYDLFGPKDSSLDFRLLDGNAPGLVYSRRF